MTRVLEVTLPEYYRTSVRPQNFDAFCDMVDWKALGPGPQALWQLKLTDRVTNRIIKETWTKNVVTDNGGNAMLKNVWNNAASAVGIMNLIAIGLQSASTTTTASYAPAASIATIAVSALPAALPAGATMMLGYGTGNTLVVTSSVGAALNATTIPISAPTTNTSGSTFPVGSPVVQIPTTSDNPPTLGPASVVGAQYSSALSAGAFTFSGTGAGNRQVVITFTFNGGSYTAGTYNEAFTCNVNPIVAGSTASHLITTGMSLNTSTNLTVTITEKV